MKKYLEKTGFPYAPAIFLYILSYGFTFFFLDTYFWDDWFSKSLPASIEKSNWRSQGFPPWDYFVPIDLLDRNPVKIRLLVFIIFFVCGWFVHQILQTVDFLSKSDKHFVTLIFLVMPINSARVALDNFHYSFSLFAFYLAWYLLVTRKKLVFKLLSVPIFLFSFSTLAFLVFLVVPASHYFLLNYKVFRTHQIRKFIGPLALTLLAPLYWIFTKVFFAPTSDLEDYYKPQFSGTLRGLILLSATTAYFTWAIRRHGMSTPSREVKVGVGLQLVSLGSFPYITSGRLVDISEWMINFVPRLSDWESRHQLLLGLGLAIIAVGLFGNQDSLSSKRGVYTFITLCLILNSTFMHSYWLDSRKQAEIIEALEDSSEIKSGTVIMFNDLTTTYNARGRKYRWYEWHGMMQKSFGDSERAVVDFRFIDCKSDNLIPDVLVTIFTNQGRLKSTVSGNIGIQISATKIHPCSRLPD